MKLTPLEIRKQEFKKSLRGLDSLEVQTFLEMVADQYEELVEENKSLSRRIIELETKLEDYQASEKNLRETLLNVQEVKKQSEESSRRQADLVIKDAELKALELLENARKETRQIREEVNWLKSQKESFINRIRHILTSQIELLSVMEIDDVIPDDADRVLRRPRQGERNRASADRNTPAAADEEDGADGDPEPETPRASKKDAETDRVIKPYAPEAAAPTDGRDVVPDAAADTDPGAGKTDAGGDDGKPMLTEDDINDFFKKGLQIDDLIKSIHKKDDK